MYMSIRSSPVYCNPPVSIKKERTWTMSVQQTFHWCILRRSETLWYMVNSTPTSATATDSVKHGLKRFYPIKIGLAI